jgi:hypothetical protein
VMSCISWVFSAFHAFIMHTVLSNHCWCTNEEQINCHFF